MFWTKGSTKDLNKGFLKLLKSVGSTKDLIKGSVKDPNVRSARDLNRDP